jgi:hypothetical protein
LVAEQFVFLKGFCEKAEVNQKDNVSMSNDKKNTISFARNQRFYSREIVFRGFKQVLNCRRKLKMMKKSLMVYDNDKDLKIQALW